jgi:phosphate starvation-inducible membrane PsiE
MDKHDHMFLFLYIGIVACTQYVVVALNSDFDKFQPNPLLFFAVAMILLPLVYFITKNQYKVKED